MITGGCRCGDIEYACADRPTYVGNCHCLDCQKFSGAPFVNWALFRRSQVRVTQGRPREISCTQGVYRSFCGRCGTHLFWQQVDSPLWMDVTVCSLDNPLPHEPEGNAFVTRKLPWVILDPKIPHHPKGPFEPADHLLEQVKTS